MGATLYTEPYMQIPENARVLRVKVFPDAGADEVLEKGDGIYEIYVSAPPSQNRANTRMLTLLAKHRGVERGRLRILSGHLRLSKTVLESGDGAK